jgi:hypothetical protein
MPVRESLTAYPIALIDVLSNGKRYEIPRFQRDYAWTQDEWEELWDDLMALGDTEGSHYMGALVLQSTNSNDTHLIIDGQQRLVTLSLLVLAFVGRIEALIKAGVEVEENRDRVRLLRERFVTTKDPASLTYRHRLKLNDNDNGFYSTYLLELREPASVRKLRTSERRLHGAIHYFDSKARELFGDAASGEQLAGFLNHRVASRLQFIQIVVHNDETAFTVFETLNARGISLGAADLLKNYLFSMAQPGGEADVVAADTQWKQVLRYVDMEEMDTLLFYHLAASVPHVREKSILAAVKRQVSQRDVAEFLLKLEVAAMVYQAMGDTNSEFWADFPPGVRRSVSAINASASEQVKMVVLAAYPVMRADPNKFARLLHNLVVITVRGSVAKLAGRGDRQRAFQDVALKITRGDLKSPSQIAHALRSVTPSDEEFLNAFETLSIDPKGPRKKWLRYLLGELEVAFGGVPVNLNDGASSIEHILPENPAGGFDAFSAEDRHRDLMRLGNLTPLEPVINRSLGAAPYEAKRNAYQQSPYALSKSITAVEWTPDALRARQRKMAELAVKTWRIEESDS